MPMKRPQRRETQASGLRRIAVAAAMAFALLAVPLAQAQAAAPAEEVLGQNELPIHDAARRGDADRMQRLLREDPAQRDRPNQVGSMPLHLAAMNADPGPLRALIAAGARVNARDPDGATPLHMAAYASRTENAVILLQAGADPLLKTNIGRDVLSMARKVRADELAGVVSLWILKGCKAGSPC
jgi:ankyrin repeat protein